ncbi:MAG: hypothetical protein U9Q15_03955 [Patescibacteria group bacterium]|nr:hypothetical protein [Patescibacteria group bacterium]
MFGSILKYIASVIVLVIVARYLGFDIDPTTIVNWTADQVNWIIGKLMPYAEQVSDKAIDEVINMQQEIAEQNATESLSGSTATGTAN